MASKQRLQEGFRGQDVVVDAARLDALAKKQTAVSRQVIIGQPTLDQIRSAYPSKMQDMIASPSSETMYSEAKRAWSLEISVVTTCTNEFLS